MRRHRSPLWKAFVQQRIGARGRGIPFLLTYSEWKAIWDASGVLHLRGRYGDNYVMARPGDQGPYAVGNVKIITHRENLSEGHKGMKFTAEAKSKMSAAWKPKPESVNKKISRALKGRTKSDAHRAALSSATLAAQARMRAEGRRIGRPPTKPLKVTDSTVIIHATNGEA